MLTERDWVMRAVKQLGEAILRAFKLARGGERELARQTIEGASATALGMEWRVLLMLDAAAAVDLLGSAQRGDAFARLVEAMAEVERLGGDESAGRSLDAHAVAVRAELTRRWPKHAKLR